MNAVLLFPRRIHGIGTEPAQTRAGFVGIVDVEGGGLKPHPEGGGTVSGSSGWPAGVRR